MQLYKELADWWQLISPTSDYADEAVFFINLFKENKAETILEMGAGGGNIAWYFKKYFQMTLTDISPEMVAMSQKQNPECEHVLGDMRTVKLNKKFDGIFIHDAIMYILSEKDLLRVFENAYQHCRAGGMIVVAPDCTTENFKTGTEYEGHDGIPPDQRSVRYIQWVTDPDPKDTVFNYDFVLALREGEQLKTVVDRQMCGLFPRRTWLDLLKKAGFDAQALPDVSSQGEAVERVEVFVGYKRKESL